MGERVRKMIKFRFDRYRETEAKLEKLAAKGLFLEECGSFFWTFRRGEPQKLKYTIAYFSEGSVFNPGFTQNQQTYFDYAEAAGWRFVTQSNQLQIFCTGADNPIPFETDEGERLLSIKRSMKKSFLPSMLMLMAVFALNLVVQARSFRQNPVDFLADPLRLLPVVMFTLALVYEIYATVSYFLWCRRSEQSIAAGGACAEGGALAGVVDNAFIVLMLGSFVWILLQLAPRIRWFGLLLTLAQVPIFRLAFTASIKYLKKRRASATVNRVVSILVLVVVNLAYLSLMMWTILRFGFAAGGGDYRTVEWPVTDSVTHEYRLYSHELPLTAEDLYGPTDYEYYSYQREAESTWFLKKSLYRQDALPARDAPPQLEYEVLEPQFDWVYRLLADHLLTPPDWRDDLVYRPIDPQPFGAAEAYQRQYSGGPSGRYLLFFEDKIIDLHLDQPATAQEIEVIKEKLID